MRILRIKLKSYRGVAESEVRLAPAGVTVIQGPNGIGKSSLAEAVDVVFKHLDSSGHRDVKALKPVHADEGAEVEVDVECGSYAFTFFKRFHKRAATRLEVSRPRPESLTGREAHERARAILAEVIDLDLWDALRIQQGSAVEQADLKDQPSLAAALDRAAGGSSAGEGEETLFEAARQEFDRYYTETGKPRKALEESENAVAAARQELAALERDLAALDVDIARSARLENEIRRLGGEQARLGAQAKQREDEWRAVQARMAALQGLEAKHREAALVAKHAAAEVETREKLVASLGKARLEQEKLQADSADGAPQRQVLGDELEKAAAELGAARAAEEAALGLLELRRRDFDFRRDELDLKQLRERQDRIAVALEGARTSEQLLRESRMTDALLADIEQAHVALEVARSRLDAARTELHVEALGDIVPEVGGTRAPLAGGERRSYPVEGTLELELPGVARLTVRSGASAAALGEEHERARRRLLAPCEKGGVASLAGAREANEARREAERVKAQKDGILEENLRDLTPAVMAGKIADLELRCGGYMTRRAQEPAIAPNLDGARDLFEAVAPEATAASARRAAAEKALDRARGRHDAHEKREHEGAIRMELARKNVESAEKALGEARARQPDEELQRAREDVLGRARAAEAAYLEASRLLAAEQPERAEELARSAHAARETATRELRRAEDELLEVTTRLRDHGEDGLEERRGAARARLERLELEGTGLLARACAAKLLFETLREMRDAARRKYVAPLRERIERLGRIVFDESFQVDLADDLQVLSRTLGGRTVPFKGLNVGAQEQIGVIARLACAMTISAEGGVPVILDDALGYSDPEHLEKMGVVLAIAGREAQVIVLTCMPDRYRHVGNATVVRLG